MRKSRWPDFLFTLVVRLFCGILLGCLLCVLLGYRGILGAFSRNHIRSVEVWFGLWGVGGGLVAVFTTPRWQTPWYQGIAGPSSWKSAQPGLHRETILERLGQPSGDTNVGEDVWRQGQWELRVRYDENNQVIEVFQSGVE